MDIPLVDLGAQYLQIGDEVQAAISRVVKRSSFILGEEVSRFEEDFARFCQVRHCVGVASGTDALELALRAVGVGFGDEVILPANTFIATALAVMRAGATPVLVDIDDVSYLVDPAAIAEKVGSATKAVIPVHLYGQVCRMEEITSIADSKSLEVVEDAAQAQGARRNGVGAGGFGIAAGTSFYPGKNIGAYGDAGAVLTNSAEVAQQVRRLRNWGSDTKYHHPEIGFNSRLDTIQAAVLGVKLRYLEDWNEARRRATARYDDLLQDLEEVSLPATLDGNQHVWHLYVVRVPQRDQVVKKLHDSGIGAGIHYPVPIHLQGALSFLGHKEGDFPVAEKAAKEILSLPIFPEITSEQQERVVEQLRKAIR